VPPISFNRASLAGNEFRYIFQALEIGHISGDGGFTKKCHDNCSRRSLLLGKALLTDIVYARVGDGGVAARNQSETK